MHAIRFKGKDNRLVGRTVSGSAQSGTPPDPLAVLHQSAEMTWSKSLEARLLTAVCGVALISIAVFAWLSIRYEQKGRVDLMIRGASQFSDTVKRSIHYSMLQNRWARRPHHQFQNSSTGNFLNLATQCSSCDVPSIPCSKGSAENACRRIELRNSNSGEIKHRMR